jgi:hypothetical protein
MHHPRCLLPSRLQDPSGVPRSSHARFQSLEGHPAQRSLFHPVPVNGAITHELYYYLVRSHHENMANICSFAISGIGKLGARMLTQANNDPNSLIETTFADIILNAKNAKNNEMIFSSIEITSASQTKGRYLLLTNKNNLHAAEHMIDGLIKYIDTEPNITNNITISGERIRCANRI